MILSRFVVTVLTDDDDGNAGKRGVVLSSAYFRGSRTSSSGRAG